MTTLRRLRLGAAFLALVSVTFAQFAIASYACPGAAAMSAVAASQMPDMPGCDKVPELDRTALCHAHCQQGDQSSERVGVSAALAAMPCAPPSVLLVVLAGVATPPEAAPQASLLERPTGPPLPVRHCCLRI